MISSIYFATVFAFSCHLQHFVTSTTSYPTDVLDINCVTNNPPSHFIRYLNSSATYGQVLLTNQPSYSNNMDCTLTVIAMPGFQLQAKLRYLDIYKLNGDMGRCYPDTLHIAADRRSMDFCGAGTPDDMIVSREGRVDISFVSGNWDFINNHRGFELYYTAFQQADAAGCGQPPGQMIRCQSGACISSLLLCDGIDNCGDGSDENQCGLNKPKVAAIVLVCLAIIVALVMILIIHFVVRRSRCQKLRSSQLACATESTAVAVDCQNSSSRHDSAPSRDGARSQSPPRGSPPPAYEHAMQGVDVTPPTTSAHDVSHFTPGVTAPPSNADATLVNARQQVEQCVVCVSGDALQPSDKLMTRAPPYAPRDTGVSPPPYGPPPAYSDAALHKSFLPHQSLPHSQHDSDSSVHNDCLPLSPPHLQPLSSHDSYSPANGDTVQQASYSPYTSHDSVTGCTHKPDVKHVDIGDVVDGQTTLGHTDTDNTAKVKDNDTLACVT